MADKANQPQRFIRIKEVLSITSLSKSDLYRRIADGTFPTQVKLGPMTTAWQESEVRAWMDARIAERSAA
ncbi:transcriptional regulator, AlpA family [Pseudomonas citronellolis]|uniref:Transcriptional regulator, AlpA family n=1 Tax=Pseudomonas citronellolis TaxID=53408 RepID=A0AAQ1KEW3_9PSED|nr:AlpA family transcriptional regulator [Pseudomonas citronellolis]TGC24234.1 AlpA family transcriptional regulator [Pseudomonas citronellolis]SFC49986.1 transcriptional regulator, AlpA family [Pseudomonas citronellolis]